MTNANDDKKTVAINESAYKSCRAYAFHADKSIKEVIESAIAEYIANHPIEAIAPPEVVRIGAIQGRPVKRKPAKVLEVERIYSKFPEIPLLLDSADIQEERISLDVTGDHMRGFTAKSESLTEVFTVIICDNGKFFGFEELALMQGIQGYDNVVEVKQIGNGFYPANEQAEIIISWMENRETFSKELLFLLHKAGMRIVYSQPDGN